MKLAYICSPCRGDYEKNIIKAQEYCREAMNDGLLPLAPHVYFTQFVDDTNPEERKLGLRCGLQLLRHCQLIRVYGCKVSAGMYDEIQLAECSTLRSKFSARRNLSRTCWRSTIMQQ
ncbi:hypothetical protein ROSINTL182_05569 [Roseburia intestinalis L1-82]|uniref:DUF7768 domain-containing protein n=1 Tax=Roseburia intestinalis L1-82 TaxID=536231 RepID=C7G6Q4_9FIRM|nr:hypothetical protein [Roseburia intestinalis]EEV02494.1 hypothetical protein ROSINTL182_05569 [Roseburia intestinalis L1-82]